MTTITLEHVVTGERVEATIAPAWPGDATLADGRRLYLVGHATPFARELWGSWQPGHRPVRIDEYYRVEATE